MGEMKNPLKDFKFGENPLTKNSKGKKEEVLGKKSVIKKIIGGFRS